MLALVVYESMFGNTRDVARAVAEGIGSQMPVEALEVAAAPAKIDPDVALLVIGAPTHGHGMTKPETRADAARRAGDRLVSRGTGIREWLETLSLGPTPIAVAVFDTRIKGPGLLWGSAAKGAAKRLQSLGFRLVAPPESFLVDGPTGPLFDRLVNGEIERATAWGTRLAAGVAIPVGAR